MLKLRYPADCAICASALPAGTRAQWDPSTRKVTCSSCVDVGRGHASASSGPRADRGRPGSSAQREYLRRKGAREARTRRQHPHLGGLLLAWRGSPRHESAFRVGATGERSIARSLERRGTRRGAVILHDRRMPRGHGNIDHLAISPTGIYVIDAKNIGGKVTVTRPLFGAAKLTINGRDRTRLLDGLDRQVAAVRQALVRLRRTDVAVCGVLCFTAKATLPLVGSSQIRGHQLHHRRAICRKLNRHGPLTAEAIDALAAALASAFPCA
jgi:hypothetical protein